MLKDRRGQDFHRESSFVCEREPPGLPAEDQARRQQICSDLNKFSQPVKVNLGRTQRLTTGWFLFFLPSSADIYLKKFIN